MAKEVIWIEDECTRGTDGHEDLPQAWQRIFGTPYDPKRKIRTIDHGDSLEHQFPGNVSVWNVYGAWDEICRTLPPSEAPNSGNA